MNPQAANVYNSLLSDSKLMPLSLFKSNKFSKYNLFPHAHTLPAFFQNNLQNQGRIVKYLKGPEGALRGFYYQLFKLGFEVDQTAKNYASIIKNVIFDPQLTVPSENPIIGKQYNISQYQKIIAQFIKIMQSQVIPNAELTFSQYPIIDQSMLAILSLIVEKLYKQSRCKMETLSDLLTSLCDIFQITLQVYDNCYSFEQSDVFLYAQSPTSFYLAFLSQMAQVQSIDQTSESPLSQQFKEQLSSNSYVENKEETNIYKDMRLSAGNRGTRAKVTNKSIKQSRPNVFTTMSEDHSRSLKLYQSSNQKINRQDSQSRVSFDNQEQKIQNNHKNLEQNIEKRSRRAYPLSSEILPKYGNTEEIKQINQDKGDIFKLKEKGLDHRYGERQINQTLQIMSKTQFDQRSSLNNRSNQGLNQVFQSIHTYKSIIDSLPESLDRPQNKKLKDIKDQKDVMSKFGVNLITQSVQYQQKQKKTQRKGLQINLNGNLYKYEFKSLNYQQNKLQYPTKDPEPQISMFKKKPEKNIQPWKPYQQKQTFVSNKIKSPPKSQIYEQILKGKALQNKLIQPQIKITQFSYQIPLQSPKFPIEKKETDIQFYVPKQRYPSLSQNQNHIEPNSFGNTNKKQQTLGTFYRQFTDTRVMQIMDEPFKTKVKLTREKFKGIRSKNFKGFF